MSNTISSRSFMNRLKSNPAAAFGILIALVGIAALVWFFVFRGKKGQAGPGAAAGGEPVLEFEITGTKKVSKVNTTSEYAMRGYEYAEPPHLGDNVDFTVTLKTKSGWEDAGVTKVRLYRQKTITNPDGSNTVVDLIGTNDAPYIETTGIEDFESYDITLDGEDLTDDAVTAGGGSNTLILVPIKSGDSVFGANNGVEDGGIATTTIRIEQKDLNYKREGVNSTAINWRISVPTGSAFYAAPGVITKNRYKIRKLTGENEVSLEPGSVSDTWKFKVHPTDTSVNAYYITARVPATPGGAQPNPVDQFKLSKVSTTVDDYRYRILSGGKLLTWEGDAPTGESTDHFQLIDQLELTEEQADNTIVTITTPDTTPATTPPTPATTPATPSAADKFRSLLGDGSGAYIGQGDISGMTPLDFTGTDFSACYTACDANPNCGSFTVGGNTCYFKPPVDPYSINFGLLGGEVLQNYLHKDRNTAYMGDGVDDAASGVANIGDEYEQSINGCKTDCLKDSGCYGIVTMEAADGKFKCAKKAAPKVLMDSWPTKDSTVTYTYYDKVPYPST